MLPRLYIGAFAFLCLLTFDGRAGKQDVVDAKKIQTLGSGLFLQEHLFFANDPKKVRINFSTELDPLVFVHSGNTASLEYILHNGFHGYSDSLKTIILIGLVAAFIFILSLGRVLIKVMRGLVDLAHQGRAPSPR